MTPAHITATLAASLLSACSTVQTVDIHEWHINNATEKCNGKTACSAVIAPGECNVWINAKATTESDYGAAVRKCFAGRV